MADMLKDIDVFVLAGGFGKRLKKICPRVPKPMVKIGGKPFLDILLARLQEEGFGRFILGTGYKAQYIEDYYRRLKRRDVHFSRETEPLDTGGAVKKARAKIKSEDFFVLNGDSFCSFNAQDFLDFHRVKKAAVSILLRKVDDGTDYGAITVGKEQCITAFKEKTAGQKNIWVNAGVYIFNRKIFKMMPHKRRFSLERDIFPALAGKAIYGFKGRGGFIDIGTPERYFQAQGLLKNG